MNISHLILPVCATAVLLPAVCIAVPPITAPSGNAAPGITAPPSPIARPQQQKMNDCSAQASEQALDGKDREEFMTRCLQLTPADIAAANPVKREECRRAGEAKRLKAGDLDAFVNGCVRGE